MSQKNKNQLPTHSYPLCEYLHAFGAEDQCPPKTAPSPPKRMGSCNPDGVLIRKLEVTCTANHQSENGGWASTCGWSSIKAYSNKTWQTRHQSLPSPVELGNLKERRAPPWRHSKSDLDSQFLRLLIKFDCLIKRSESTSNQRSNNS